jgi:hypothetical protein
MFSSVTQNDLANLRPLIYIEVMRSRRRRFFTKELCKQYSFIGKRGDRLTIPTVGDFAVKKLGPTDQLTPQTFAVNNFEVIVDQADEITVGVRKNADDVSVYAVRQIIGDGLSYALDRYLDFWILGMRAAIPTANRVFKSSDAAATGIPQPLDNATVQVLTQRALEGALDMSMLRWVLSPQQITDLLNVIQFTSRDYSLGDLAYKEGAVGFLYGVPVICTPQITNNTLVGWKNGTGGAPAPTSGVAGSEFIPTQFPVGQALVTLPRGQTGSEVANPFMTGMLATMEWSILMMQHNSEIEIGYEMINQRNLLSYTSVYGHGSYRSDSCFLVHSKGSTNPNA